MNRYRTSAKIRFAIGGGLMLSSVLMLFGGIFGLFIYLSFASFISMWLSLPCFFAGAIIYPLPILGEPYDIEKAKEKLMQNNFKSNY